MSETKREQNLDLLRIVALAAVILMHSAPENAVPPATAFGAAMLRAVWAGVTWCVPCFVMISGRFFLDPARRIDARRIWTKYIPRIAAAFAVWSVVYVLFYRFVLARPMGVQEMLSQLLSGAYHMWYLFLIAGLYMIAPLLRPIAADRKLSAYFLLLFLLMSALTGYGPYLPRVGWAISQTLENAHIQMVLGYSGYFLLGWALTDGALSRRAERLLYAGGLACFVFTCLAPSLLPIPEGESPLFYQMYLKPNVIVESAALYAFFARRVPREPASPRARSAIRALADLNFGMYLSHVLFLELLAPCVPGVSVFLWLPAQVALTFVLSAGLTWLLRRVPALRRIC